MPFESLTSTPLMRRLTANDSPSQLALVQKLSMLNLQVMELLAQQPRFESFVQQQFDQHFSQLTPRLEVRRTYVQPEPTPLLPNVLDAVVQRIVTGQASTYASRDTLFFRASDEGGDPQPVTALTGQAFDGFVDGLATDLAARYKAFVQAFWVPEHGSPDARSCKQRLIDIRLDQLRSEVALLKNDGLITAAAEALFNTLLRYPDALARRALKGYRPCVYGLALKGAALHGAFVLTSRDPQDDQVTPQTDTTEVPQVRPVHAASNLGIVLLFSPHNGLEEFDSLASLDRELHRRLNHAVEFNSLLGLMAEKHQPQGLAQHREGKSSDQLTYLEWLDAPISHAIEDQCLKLQEDFLSTVARYQALPAQADSAWLPESLDRVTDLSRAFDGNRVLAARVKKRGQAQLHRFLESATAAEKLAWLVAMQNYCDELSNLPEAEGLPNLAEFSDKTTLLAYSNAQLRPLLKAQFELDADPDEILIHTREPYIPPITLVPGAPAPAPREPGTPLYIHRKRSLTQLALENVGGLDLGFIHFSRLTDKTDAPYTALTAGQVKDLVRTANIGDSYDALLKDRLVTSPGALAHKSNFARGLARQVRLDAIEAKIAGDFLPDQWARGFNWVQVVLDQPEDSDQRETIEGHRIVVQCLKLRGQRVRGVWLFRSASAGGGSTVVYAPQAPGGRVFHEYPDGRLLVDFVHNSSWREYLVGRVEKAQQRAVRAILRGRGDMSMTHMPRIANNLFEEAYEVEANFAINDAGAQSTTTEETDVETGITVAVTAFDIAAMVLPIKVMLPIGLARSLFSVFNAVDAASLGDRSAAAHHLVRALGEFVGALVDGVIGAQPRPPVAAARGLNPQMALRKKPDGLQVLSGWEGKGIYYKASSAEGARQYFLHENKLWFSILDDGGQQAWRVRDVRKSHQHHHAPIRLDSQRRWEVGSHPGRGWKGGISPDQELMTLYPFLSESSARLVFESFNFPRGRELEFQLSLVHYLRSGTDFGPFNQYLMVTPRRLLLRLRGGDLPGTPLTPVEPAPGPGFPRPARPPSERFADWGQTIEAAQLQVQHAQMGIYRRIGGPQALIGTEYIKIDELYYAVLPSGAGIRRDSVLMRDPNQSFRTYEQFELMLRRDRFDQPRPATFAAGDGRWVTVTELPFQKTLSLSVNEAFPMLTAASQVEVARALFNRANPDGLTVWGIAAMQRTLQDWRLSAPPGRATLGDPLLLLPRTPRMTNGHWPLDYQPGRYTQLTFRTDQIPVHLHNSLVTGTEGTLKALMSEVLTRNGYRVLSGYSAAGELLFSRPARDIVYWLSLRRVVGNVVDGRPGMNLKWGLMNAETGRRVSAAQAGNKLVWLLGGTHLPAEGSAAGVFILRV